MPKLSALHRERMQLAQIRQRARGEYEPATTTPAHLLDLWMAGLRPLWVAVDTETSGLFADDGARTSIVSCAWPDEERVWGPDRFDGLTWREEEIDDGYVVPIVSVAWPFDQGREGKGLDFGQDLLWPDAKNHDIAEWDALLSWLECVNALTMHNSPFDVEKLRVGVARFNQQGVEGVDLRERVDWDTQNVNDMLWGWEKTGLKPSCQRIWPERWPADDSSEKRVKDYLRKNRLPAGRYDLIPWAIIGGYADDDARMTAMLKLRQQWRIRRGREARWLETPGPRAEGAFSGALRSAARRLAVSDLLGRMTARGLPYHAVGSLVAAEKARDAMRPLAEKLPFHPGRDADAKTYYFGAPGMGERTSRGETPLGLEPYAVTDGGNVSLTAEVLGRMVLDGVPWAAEYAEWKRAATAVSMWYQGYADKIGPDGRLRTYFRQNGTRSTRFSVERVQLQAIPADYRFSGVAVLEGIPTPRQLIAQAVAEDFPGWQLYELDLAQAELRIAALYASRSGLVRSKMLEMIQAGEDMHSHTTRALFVVDESDPRWGELRQVGKRGNFSLGFGSGGATFQRMLAEQAGIRWDLDQCNGLVYSWRRLYPEFVGADGRGGAVFRHARVVERRMYQDSASGGIGLGWVGFKNRERRWFQPYEEAHKAYNQRVQGDQAQFNIDWLLLTEQYLRGLGLDAPEATRWSDSWAATRGGAAGLLLPVHDSQVLLLPAGPQGMSIAEDCAQFGRDLWKQWFPGVPGEIEVKTW